MGDGVGGYKMVGIPDGLGAYDNGDGTFTVLMNRELGDTAGIACAHGAKGAFVSEWVFDKTTLEVKSGNDLIQNVFTYDAISGSYVEHNAALGNGVAFNRFCSADLADQSVLQLGDRPRLQRRPLVPTARNQALKAARSRILPAARRPAIPMNWRGSAIFLRECRSSRAHRRQDGGRRVGRRPERPGLLLRR